jgi:hypothetical protein
MGRFQNARFAILSRAIETAWPAGTAKMPANGVCVEALPRRRKESADVYLIEFRDARPADQVGERKRPTDAVDTNAEAPVAHQRCASRPRPFAGRGLKRLRCRSTDFCPAVRPPCDSLSPFPTRGRSPGVSSAAFRAQPPDLRFAPSMDMDFAVSRPLVRHALYPVFVHRLARLLYASFRPTSRR